MVQEGPNTAKEAAKTAQDGPMRAPRRGTLTDISRPPTQDDPRVRQEAPKRPKSSPRKPPRGP
eukprot:2851894-Pyramimonas_sp.AAC.1